MPWDSPLAALADIVAATADLDSVAADGGLRMDSVVVETPLELTAGAFADGSVLLMAAPPRQAGETTVMPILHRLRLRVEVAS